PTSHGVPDATAGHRCGGMPAARPDAAARAPNRSARDRTRWEPPPSRPQPCCWHRGGPGGSWARTPGGPPARSCSPSSTSPPPPVCRLPPRLPPATPAGLRALRAAEGDSSSWGRGVAAATVLAGLFAVLAVLSRGQLGWGDVALAVPVAAALGWHSWTAVY